MLRTPMASDWLFWILATGTLGIGLFKMTRPHRFRAFVRMPFMGHQANEFEDRRRTADLVSASMDAWAVLCIALALTLIDQGTLRFNDWALAGRYALALSLFIAVQGFLYQLAGTVFDDHKAYHLAWKEKITFIRWSILWITPLVWWLAFAPGRSTALGLLAVILLIALYAWALFRTTRILWKQSHLNKYHSILYLCALEISPLLILVSSLDQ